MKILRKISAILFAVAIFGSTAMAADFKFDEKIEANTDAEQVIVNFYVNDGIATIGADSVFVINYDADVYTYNETDTVLNYTADFRDYGGFVQWQTPNGTNVDIGDEKCLVKIAFDVIEGKSPVGTSFVIDADNSLAYDADYNFFEFPSESITVTAAAPAGTSTKTVYAEETYALSNETFDFGSTYDFAKKWNVVVKYNNAETKTYGWSWKNNLGIEGEGTVTGKVKFGVKISDTSKYDATLFTFDLVEVQ